MHKLISQNISNSYFRTFRVLRGETKITNTKTPTMRGFQYYVKQRISVESIYSAATGSMLMYLRFLGPLT